MLIITLVTALMISFVAAFYAISGLTMIFSGAFYSILLMGSVLEIGKLVTVSWLHRNWSNIKFLMKLYMLVAVSILMIITSMGIFGFLSRAHLETTTIGVSEYSARMTSVDRIIDARERNLETINNQIQSIDASFDRFVELGAISRGIAERERFRDERLSLENERRSIEEDLFSLLQEKNALQIEIDKIQVEIGPLKYIAELIYGDNAEKHFDSAVRWIIILLVLVFDPLAIILLLAANQNMAELRRIKIAKSEIATIEIEENEIIDMNLEQKKATNFGLVGKIFKRRKK